MYQIDVPTAVAGLPTPAAAGTAGFFTNGNPSTGTPATIVPADFLNMIMQELINVALEGTAPLSKSSYTQVRDAISNMVANASAGVGQVTNVTGVAPINSSGGATPAISISAATDSAPGSMSAADKTKLDGIAAGATANAGTVTAVTVVSANGVSASVANQGTTPALTISLGTITPNSISCGGAASAISLAAAAGITGATIQASATGSNWQVNVTDGTRWLRSFANSDPNNYGECVQLGDQAILFSNGTVATGALTISAWGASLQGFRLTASGNHTAGGNFAFSGNLSAASYGAVNATTGTFSGALTCTTMNATGSDRRLKRNIRKTEPRPLHRSIPYVSFKRKADGSHGRGAIAQHVRTFEPCYVGTFTLDGKEWLSLDYQSMAYEQAIWAGREVDRLTLRIAKLEHALAKAKIEPRKRGFVRRLLEAIW